MVNRAQCSLIIEDNDLFTNLVQPLKLNKQLAPFILKLLGVYYHNSEIRDAIDGAPDYKDDTFDNDISRLFKETREAFYMLDYFTQSANGSVEEGIKQMKEVISTNPDDFGKPIGALAESPQDVINEALKEGQARKETENERLNTLESSVTDLSSKLDLILEKLNNSAIESVSVPQSVVSSPVVPVVKQEEASMDDASVNASSVADDILAKFNTGAGSSDDDDLLVFEEASDTSDANASLDGANIIKGLVDSLGL